MHELAITRSIVAIVSDAAHGRKVTGVTLQIGRLSGVLPDAIAFCFDVVTQGTAIEGATLHIDVIPGHARCRECGQEFVTDSLFAPCACGSRAVSLINGEELKIKTMEIEEQS
jgi:hydrogenase nickel incorporation protein HypA/HybF